MSYAMLQRYFPAGYAGGVAVATIDYSDAAATTEFTWVPQSTVVIYGWGGVATEAMGTMTSTPGVGSLTIGTAEVSTITALPAAAIGTETNGTQLEKPIRVDAGTSVIIKVKTQAVGGTIVGEHAVFLWVEFFPNISPNNNLP